MSVSPSKLVIIVCESSIAIIGAVLGIFFFDGQAAQVVGFCTFIYAVVTIKLEMHFHAEDSLFEKFPLLHSLRECDTDSEMLTVIKRFHEINHPLLNEIKKSAWIQFSTEISSLCLNKRSDNLTPAEYIGFIEGQLKKASNGSRVIAVSLYGQDEFLDNNYEKNFHEAQKYAVSRGVQIERIFLCSLPRMYDLKETPYWSDHLGLIDGRFADLSDVESSGVRVRSGFILIDDALFDDRPLQIGLSGIVSTNQLDIDRARKVFSSLERHAIALGELA